MESISLNGWVPTSWKGNQKLVCFYNNCKETLDEEIYIDIDNLIHIDANLSALFYAILANLHENYNKTFTLDIGILEQKFDVLIRNGFAFLATGNSKYNLIDERESTIKLREFEIEDIDSFIEYIDNELLNHRSVNDLDEKIKDQISLNYQEIFGNVDLHANTNDPIIACGQYFPTKRLLNFSIVDRGDGFLKKIRKFTKGKQNIDNAKDAIEWAIKGGSTKKDTPGGTGLKSILNYSISNKGQFHIVSNDCYYFYKDGKIEHQIIENNFIGTTIHLIFRL
jgi:hypothetical protein